MYVLLTPHTLRQQLTPLKESAVSSVSAAEGNVEASVTTWLDHGEGGQTPQLATNPTAGLAQTQTPLAVAVGRNQSSRFVHRNTVVASDNLQAADAVAGSPGTDAANRSTSAGPVSVLSPGSGIPSVHAFSPVASASSPALSASSVASSVIAAPFSVTAGSAVVSATDGPVSDGSRVGTISTHSGADFGTGFGRGFGRGLDTQVGLESALEIGTGTGTRTGYGSTVSAEGDQRDKSAGSRRVESPVVSVSSPSSVPSASSESAFATASEVNPSSDRGEGKSIDQSSATETVNNASASPHNVDNVQYGGVLASVGRVVQDSESGYDVALATAESATQSTISQSDASGVGRSSSAAGHDRLTATELVTVMQTVINRTLIAAACLQSAKLRSEAPTSRVCREYGPFSRAMVASLQLVAAIC